MCGSTHIFRNHQGVELMGYGNNGNEFDRIVWRLENAPKAKHERAFSLHAGIDMNTGRLPMNGSSSRLNILDQRHWHLSCR